MLRLSDFREGWTKLTLTAAQSDQLVSMTTDAQDCIGGLPQPARAARGDFRLSELTVAASSAELMRTVEDAQMAFRAVTSERAAVCSRDLFEKALHAEGLDVASTTVEPVEFPIVGDEMLSYRLVAALRRAEQIPIYVETVLIREGAFLLSLGFANAGSPFVSDVAIDLVRRMASRAE